MSNIKSVGDYQLRDRIGKGSYADVYKGVHKTSGIKYAVKVISKENLNDPKLMSGLESEIKIMREFVHINIVRLHEYLSSEKNFYLILELCLGGDLNKFIKKHKVLDERVAINFLHQLANGLAFLQEKNFIHRDLKPANVLLSEFSENAILKLADFGFARHLGGVSMAMTRCGTPLYMAPEILESKEYDAKADIWSVGCIFYEMLVGTHPFKGKSESDLLINIKTKDLVLPKEVKISQNSIQILVKLLERNPMRRVSLDQFILVINNYVMQQSIQTTIPVFTSRTMINSSNINMSSPNPPNAVGNNSMQSFNNRPSDAVNDSPDALAKQNNTEKNGGFLTPSSLPQSSEEKSEVFSSSSKIMIHQSPGTDPRGQDQRPTQFRRHSTSEDFSTGKKSSPIYNQSIHSHSPVNAIDNLSKALSYVFQPQINKLNSNDASSDGTPSPVHMSNMSRVSNLGKTLNRVDSSSMREINISNNTANSIKYLQTAAGSKYTPPTMVGMRENEQTRRDIQPTVSLDESMNKRDSSQSGRSFSADNAGQLPVIHEHLQSSTTGGLFTKNSTFGHSIKTGASKTISGKFIRDLSVDIGKNQGSTKSVQYMSEDRATSMFTKTIGTSSNMSDDDFVLIETQVNTVNDGMDTARTINRNLIPTKTAQNASEVGRINPKYNVSGRGSNAFSQESTIPFHNLTQHQKLSSDDNNYIPANNRNLVNNSDDNFEAEKNHQESGLNLNFNQKPSIYYETEQQDFTTNEFNFMSATVYDMESSIWNAIVHRCQTYCKIVSDIAAIGDKFVRDSINLEISDDTNKNSPDVATSQESIKNIARFSVASSPNEVVATGVGSLRSRGDSFSNSIGSMHGKTSRMQPGDVITIKYENYLKACSLYLHGLLLYQNFMKTVDCDMQHILRDSNRWKSAANKIKKDISVVFDQLVNRAENCQSRINQLMKTTPHNLAGSTAIHNLPQRDPMVIKAFPAAERILYAIATKNASDGEMEDLLGNLVTACKLYSSAKDLIEIIMLTAEGEDKRKLQIYLPQIFEKYSNCYQRAKDLQLFDNENHQQKLPSM